MINSDFAPKRAITNISEILFKKNYNELFIIGKIDEKLRYQQVKLEDLGLNYIIEKSHFIKFFCWVKLDNIFTKL